MTIETQLLDFDPKTDEPNETNFSWSEESECDWETFSLLKEALLKKGFTKDKNYSVIWNSQFTFKHGKNLIILYYGHVGTTKALQAYMSAKWKVKALAAMLNQYAKL